MRLYRLFFIILLIFLGCATVQYTTADIHSEIDKYNIGSSKYLTIDGNTIHYIEEGRGKPMILIHGWLCWGAYWKKIIPLIKDQYHIYAPDLLGHGISDKPLSRKGTYSTVAQAKRIIAFMDALHIQSAYLVGHSMGGEISAIIAIVKPERVKKLVLICATGLEDTPKHMPGYVKAGLDLGMEGLVSDMMNEKLMRRHIPGLMFYKENPMPDDFVKDIMMTCFNTRKDRQAVARVTTEGLFGIFLDESCKDITKPALVVSAKYDRIIVPAMGERYHELISNSKYVCIDKAGHMVPWEQADAVAAAIRNFCR